VAGNTAQDTMLRSRLLAWVMLFFFMFNTATADAAGAFASGTWTPSATGSTITATTILSALNAGTSVTISTAGAGAEAGNITVSSPLAMTGTTSTSLTLQAANNIAINQNISSTNAPLNLVLDYGNAGSASIASGVTVNLLNGNLDVKKAGVSLASTLGLNGTLSNATLNAGTLSISNGWLNNVTIGSNLTTSGDLSIFNGLTLGNGVTVNKGGYNWYFNGYDNGGKPAGTVHHLATLGTSIGNTGGQTLTINPSAFTNSGTLSVTAGTMNVSPTTFTNSGTINVASGTTFTRTGGFTSTGTLSGSGTINVGAGNTLTNNGAISPGGAGATGTLSITGNLVLGAGSVLDAEVGSITAGNYDVLAVSGSVTLDGTLNINRVSPYSQNVGDNYPILTYASRVGGSQFVNANSVGMTVNPSYNAGNLTLNVTNVLTSNYWNVDADGDWSIASNWSLGHAPLVTEYVIIDRPSNLYTITVSNGVRNAIALTSQENLLISGGSLALGNSSSDLSTIGSSAMLTIAGGTLNGAGALNLSNLVVSNGNLGGTGPLTVTNSFNQTGGLVTRGGDVTVSHTSGNLTVGALSGNKVTLQANNGGITLNGVVSATASGDALVILANSFTNNTGASALSASNGRWLVYSQNPANDTRNGLSYNFKQYNTTYGSTILGSGNGFLYSVAPTLTPSLTGTVVKPYDGTNVATPAASNYSLSGAIDGDTVSLNNPVSGTYDTKNALSGKTVTVTGLSATATNISAIVYGYTLDSTTVSGNIGTISKAPLSVTAPQVVKTYDGTTSATGSATVGILVGAVAGEVVDTTASLAYTDKNAGVGIKTVKATGLTIKDSSNADVTANYAISYVDDTTSTINPLALTGTITTGSSTYGSALVYGTASLTNAISGDDLGRSEYSR